MTVISLIVATDEDGGIGFNNQLLCHLPADLQHFKKITMGKPIIMGRKTYESIGRPLPGRKNIVISRTLIEIPGIWVVDSLEKALNMVSEEPEVFIIGGESLYEQSISIANQIYLTRIHHSFIADTYFPAISEGEWICTSKEFLQRDIKNSFDMTFCVYSKKDSVLDL